jgi:hypothetical protein
MNYEINKLNEYLLFINNNKSKPINTIMYDYINNKINYIQDVIHKKKSDIEFIKNINTKNIEIKYHHYQKQIKDYLNYINEQNNIINQNSFEFDNKLDHLKKEIFELNSQNTITLPKLKTEVIKEIHLDINKLKKDRYQFKNNIKFLEKNKKSIEIEIFNLLEQCQKFTVSNNQAINLCKNKRKKLEIFEKFKIDDEIEQINNKINQEQTITTNKLKNLEENKNEIIKEISNINLNIEQIEKQILLFNNIKKEDNKKDIFITENKNQNQNRIDELNTEIILLENKKQIFLDQHSINSKIALDNINKYTPVLDKLVKEEHKISKILDLRVIDLTEINNYLIQLQELKVLIDSKDLSNI